MRIPIAVLVALVINLLLFALMQAMVGAKRVGFSAAPPTAVIDFVRSNPRPEPSQSRRRRKPPPKPEPAPETVRVAALARPRLDVAAKPLSAPVIALSSPRLDTGAGPYLGDVRPEAMSVLGLNDLTLLTRTPPSYPHRARRRGIEGYVEVEFIITRDGGVKDPRILAARPQKIFEQAVLRAIKGWKFEPKTREGEPVEVAVRQRFNFELDE